ncbi:MAG: AraC family transcriptional regulator [Opitutaceae bacterium]
MPELRIRTVAFHEHLPGQSSTEAHKHCWCQAILYLSGQGRQIFPDRNVRVKPGVVVTLPPGQLHAFRADANRGMSCLIIDFSLKHMRPSSPVVRNINQSELARVRQQLANLLQLQLMTNGMIGSESAVQIVQWLTTLLRAAGWLEPLPVFADRNGSSALNRLLCGMELETPLLQIVRQSGYQRDHLNRLVKKETGLTLGQFRAQRRLEKAKELLSRGMQVSYVADAIGLPSQSYFARWFRQQTGQPPTRWVHQISPSTSTERAPSNVAHLRLA